MRKSTFFLSVVIIVLVSFISGCIPSKPSESVEILPSERLIKKLEANRRKVKNFEGVGSIGISTAEINTTVSFKVILQKPDSVYIEMYGPFGIDLAQAVITSTNFAFYDVMHNILYKGSNDNDVLKRIFKVDLTFGELMDMFVGAVNLTPKLSKEPDNYAIEYDKYILTYLDSDSGRKNKYFIDVRELSITDYQLLDGSDKILAEGNYSKFNTQEGLAIPYIIQIQRIAENEKVNIEYRKIVVNKNSVKIHLNIPDDAEKVDL
ncbi:MAG: DUF4292 domain-containing protein [Ignavibacteriales bacterium]|nr:DUF4292 domain-containing protein [Ignavibacteriales bacterium]